MTVVLTRCAQGHLIPADAKYCGTCGAQNEHVPVAEEVAREEIHRLRRATARHPRSRRRTLILIAACVILVIGFGAMLEVAIPHELLREDFAAGPGLFQTAQDSSVTLEVTAGALRVSTARQHGPVWVVAPLAREAHRVAAYVDVVSVSAIDASDVGLAIGGDGGEYLLTVGAGGLRIVMIWDTGYVRLLYNDPWWKGSFTRVGLDVGEELVGGSVGVQAVIDGRVVATVKDPEGLDGFTALALYFAPKTDGASASFDNVHAAIDAETAAP